MLNMFTFGLSACVLMLSHAMGAPHSSQCIDKGVLSVNRSAVCLQALELAYAASMRDIKLAELHSRRAAVLKAGGQPVAAFMDWLRAAEVLMSHFCLSASVFQYGCRPQHFFVVLGTHCVV